MAFGGFLALIGVMRVVEMVVSAIRMARRRDAVVAEPWLFPAMAGLHTSLVVLPLVEVVALDVPFRPWIGAVAASILLFATVLRVWTLWTIGRAWNVRVVVPEASAITSSGPYAWIRHPNYLVVVLEIAAIPLLHGAWGSALVLTLWNALVLWRRIRTEEAALSQVPAWVVAMGNKKRLIPGVF
jgi:methyltransferase